MQQKVQEYSSSSRANKHMNIGNKYLHYTLQDTHCSSFTLARFITKLFAELIDLCENCYLGIVDINSDFMGF